MHRRCNAHPDQDQAPIRAPTRNSSETALQTHPTTLTHRYL